MSSERYKLTINQLEQEGNICKLESDGFDRERVHKIMYRETEGMSTTQRTELMKNLYKREPESIKVSRWI